MSIRITPDWAGGDRFKPGTIPGPWLQWKGHPETRKGVGINYIQSALDSGLDLQEIRQKAVENKWVIGADAWDKFYSDKTFEDIWNEKEYKIFREGLENDNPNPWCQSCNIYNGKRF